MMAWTDRHCRYFHRQLSRRALLYTEMVTSAALVRGGAVHLLEFSEQEHPVALQLGGEGAKELAEATRMAQEAGYKEVNLNVGCPSDRVQSGTFGAVLMKRPAHVADCLAEMQAAVDIPVTVKCRIGVDDQEPTEILPTFLEAVSAAGIRQVTIHARKAWLKGLSPKENREVPPLDYHLVYQMVSEFPALSIALNGGLETLDAAEDALAAGVDGIMIGRAAYHKPFDVLAEADQRLYGAETEPLSRFEAVEAMVPYIANHLQAGGNLHQVTRHMLGLFAGQPGARAWRRILSEKATGSGAGVDVLFEARDAVRSEIEQQNAT
ncbi:MAG: tRNA dihydrouridine(20/20a) synthase DusA [Rhodobacteraceae bacterium]|nr:tRNA dihydrouridine(20/20a) synthase DusA [Paracoccaceae bacterium]